MGRHEREDIGIGDRLAARLIALGYVQPNGRPDVRRFCREWPEVDTTSLYSWIKSTSRPEGPNLDRLSKLLGVTRGELYFGREEERPALAGTDTDALTPSAGVHRGRKTGAARESVRRRTDEKHRRRA